MIDYDALREALRDECYGCIDLEAEELTQLKTLLDKALSVEVIPRFLRQDSLQNRLLTYVQILQASLSQ